MTTTKKAPSELRHDNMKLTLGKTLLAGLISDSNTTDDEKGGQIEPVVSCPECGSDLLTWEWMPVNKSCVGDGRLTAADMESRFFLGCDECSETLQVLSADNVVEMLNNLSN